LHASAGFPRSPTLRWGRHCSAIRRRTSSPPKARTSLACDPLGRLHHIQELGLNWAYDSDGHLLVEMNASTGQVARRYVFGPGTDEPLVWYEGSGTSDRRFLHADERGSIVAVSNGAGTVTNVNSYDEYGAPATGNFGRFQYTGQAWIGKVTRFVNALLVDASRGYAPWSHSCFVTHHRVEFPSSRCRLCAGIRQQESLSYGNHSIHFLDPALYHYNILVL
jgi:hypothetical protein